MYTLYGQEAKDGDYVLVQDVAYMKGSADIMVAQVYNGKAYAASAVPCRNSSRRWLRKETAITVISETDVCKSAKELIQMNIAAAKTTFEAGTDYFQRVWTLCNQAYQEERTEREKRHGKE